MVVDRRDHPSIGKRLYPKRQPIRYPCGAELEGAGVLSLEVALLDDGEVVCVDGNAAAHKPQASLNTTGLV